MNDIDQYIEIFLKATLGCILIYYIYLSEKDKQRHAEKIYKILSDSQAELSKTLNEAIKIIKQIKRR